MNLRAEIIPGLCVLLAGALMAFFAKGLCRKPESVPQVKLLGTLLAALGAILIFLP